MHPKEARVAIGTGRLVHRMVSGSHLIVRERLDDDARLLALLARADLAPCLLFPRAEALDLDAAAVDAVSPIAPIAPPRRPLLLVPDGTWTTAKKLVRLSERLAPLPALRFTPLRPSRYGRLRKEPRATCVSTLEAVHHVIDRFDALGIASAPSARAHDHMLRVMDELVARQLAFEPVHDAAGRASLSAASIRDR
jgi:DTW domain-containing protein